MIYVSFDGRQIPALGFGTWQLRAKDCIESVAKAIEVGYRHIDTAQIYENETEVGNALTLSGIPRKEIFLTTKVWMSNVKDGALQKSVEQSLKKLETDYVDLLLIHWPVGDVPFAEQMKALAQVQKDGKARLIGVSNFTVAQMKEVVEKLGVPVATNQVEYHPFLSQKPVLDYLRSQKMFLTAYSPLARGKVNDSPALREIGKKLGKTAGQVTLRWLLQQDGVAAIPKAGSEKHMRENFDIFDFSLTQDEMKAIHAEARPDGRLISPDWAPQWDKAA
jgi:2,5-diketo-D-gluconate reductase B